MINYLKISGWLIVFILLILLLLQRSYKTPCTSGNLHYDTIYTPGDREILKVQDTILKPVKIYYKEIVSSQPIDTEKILRDYLSQKTYTDTIRSRDVIAVIKDSITGNAIKKRQVYIENKRATELIASTKNKLFCGGFLGISPYERKPGAGLSVIFLSRKETIFQYRYDFLNRAHSLGIAWKIHFPK